MRITHSMMMNSYTNRLGRVFANFDKASQKVSTQRQFLSAAENPGATARAYQLRSSFQQTHDWISNVNDLIDRSDTIDANIRVLVDMANHAHGTLLRGMNDTWSIDERTIFANELLAMQRTAVQSLNTRFDDKFIFGGSSTKRVPFELDEGDPLGTPPTPQVLRFRGIDVMTQDPVELARLQEFANEQIFVDLGFGLHTERDENGMPIVGNTSAFNVAIPGISFLQTVFGAHPDGTPVDATDNFILHLGALASHMVQEPFEHGPLIGEDGLAHKLLGQHRELLLAVTRHGADANFLDIRHGVLERNADDLNSMILNVEYIDMAEAIMNMQMAQYVYRVMLEMGGRMLQPSLIDFMR